MNVRLKDLLLGRWRCMRNCCRENLEHCPRKARKARKKTVILLRNYFKTDLTFFCCVDILFMYFRDVRGQVRSPLSVAVHEELIKNL